MRRAVWFSVAAALGLLATGCGNGMLKTQGRVVKGGQPFVPGPDEGLQILFVPILPSNQPAGDYYAAVVDQTTGTFQPAGKDRKGMPPGKYRVAIELMKKKKDQFGGKYDSEKSPYVFDIDSSTPEIVIDLDAPPAK
ncbi:hypothetical protein [Frigoriglobus tundricola]|uniref:Carboxypeptidase regulatory-like domain-containing protein n=1 Tax=Frigoriglobus tundricola TaxID=2774151 RepID=A0A6M5YMM4_9BACT|nr:hypothetical protein [Frigoriglobus tundricola]QJW94491.1 hypothetical protein FTUN_2012 [Frigoriglobus tundricola]